MTDITKKLEIHLFLIWENGQKKRHQIIEDIQRNFDVIQIENILWDKDNFSGNLIRLCCHNLPPGTHNLPSGPSRKELDSGTGPFTLIIVKDHSPVYEERQTLRGRAVVNTRVFDAKIKYRQWIGEGYKVHATDNLLESRRDVLLLTGEPYDHYATAHHKWQGNIPEDIVVRNLPGCIQWNSLEEFFSVLNEMTEYIVLRNFDGMPQNFYCGAHGDIDLLVANPTVAILLCNAKPVYQEKYRSNFKVNICNQTVHLDIRYVGDGYYDKQWEVDMLKSRKKQNGLYVPTGDHYRFGLLYHALIHKKKIADDYDHLFQSFGFAPDTYLEELKKFMNARGYQFTEPLDYSVYFNITNAGCQLSRKRKWIPVILSGKKISRKAYKTGTKVICKMFGYIPRKMAKLKKKKHQPDSQHNR